MNEAYEAEQSILGSILLIGDPKSDVIQKIFTYLKKGSFHTREHGIIYSEMKKAAQLYEQIDPLTIDSRLTAAGLSQETGGYAYLIDLAKNTPSAANVMAYVNIVREAAIKRMANGKLQEAIASLNDQDGRTVYEKIGLIETHLSVILERAVNNRDSGLKHISEIAEQWTEDLNARFENPTAMQGYSTGIESLDKILYPKLVRKGSLVVIGARPKMGKTALLNMIVGNFALNHKKAAAVFSLEMPSDQMFERMIVERARVNPDMFYKGADNDAEFAKVSAAMGEFINSNLYLDDTAGIDIRHIQKESRALAKNKELGIIAVDYLTLMEAAKADRNDLAYGAITKALKNLAKELDCVVVLLTQLNRGLETRTNKRPMPSDSRDTGQIEQDCDLWLGLYREAVYTDLSEDDQGLTELLVRLNRHGNTGTAYLNLMNGYFVDSEPFQLGPKSTNNDY